MAKTGLVGFFREVKAETKKVAWPSRRETMVSMIAVFIMVFVSSVFLYFADQIIAFVIIKIMELGM